MHLTVLACDLDGTLAEDDHVASKTWAMLRRAKAAGLAIILVTGRTLVSFSAEGPFAELCEAIVAEDGAAIYFPRRDVVAVPFGRLAPRVLQHLDDLRIPYERGVAIAATHVPHDKAILEALREKGGGATVEYNRGSVMVIPSGATKGTGLLFALQELGYSPRNVVACGDAENDRSLFEMVELAVAVANAQPDIRELADSVLAQPNGAGVQALIADLLEGSIPSRRLRPDRRLLLGHRLDGTPVHLDPFALVDGNLGIVGASGAGKSWLAGLLAEGLIKQGYQVCIIDPEGDYRGLRAFPHSIVLGGPKTQLPPVVDVVTISEYSNVNLVLDLSVYAVAERQAFVAELLRALRALRSRRGRPHWFLIDEIQSLCPLEGGELTDLLLDVMQDGGFSLVSYRPSLVAPSLLEALDHWLATRFSWPEEIETLKSFLAKHDGGSALLSKLPELPPGQAYLCLGDGNSWLSPESGLVTFKPGPRVLPHIRHLYKYLQAPLPSSKRFYFHDVSGGHSNLAAASLWEFREVLAVVPDETLQYHLRRGDFEHWFSDVLHDNELARQVRRMARRDLHGDMMRQALQEIVTNRYEELDSLA